MPCHSGWCIGHRQLVSIQPCPALPPPSSSNCTWNPPSTFHSWAPAFMCSSVALFLCGLVLSTAMLAWQCCHHSFWACDQASSTFFFSAEPTPVSFNGIWTTYEKHGWASSWTNVPSPRLYWWVFWPEATQGEFQGEFKSLRGCFMGHTVLAYTICFCIDHQKMLNKNR